MRAVNGTLMARGGLWLCSPLGGYRSTVGLSWGFGLERAKGIEPS